MYRHFISDRPARIKWVNLIPARDETIVRIQKTDGGNYRRRGDGGRGQRPSQILKAPGQFPLNSTKNIWQKSASNPESNSFYGW